MVKVYKQISELGEIITGKTPSTENSELWGGDIPFITPTDIIGYDSFYQQETERTISVNGVCKQKKTLLPENTVCVTCIGSTIGKVCVTKVPSITNQQINSIIPNKDNDYRYIYYLIRENLNYLQLIGGGSGSGTPIISKNKFGKFQFLVEEDLPIQQKIASILSTYDNLIENNTKRIKLLEQMAETLYKEWFVRFRFPGHENTPMENGLPKGWKMAKIGDIYKTCSGGTPNRANDEYFQEGNIPWVKTGEIQNTIILETEEKITDEAVRHSSAKILPKGTLLMAMYGVNIGKLGILSKPMTCNQAACAFLPIRNTLYYLFFQLMSMREYLLLIGFGAAQQNLSQALINKIRIVVPNDNILNQFENKVDALYRQIENLKHQNANLTRQRDLLLPRLMSGKLEVTP